MERPDQMGTAENDWHVRERQELRDMIDARMYPTVKYAVGHRKGCTRIVVGGTAVTFDHGRARAAEAVRTA